MTCLRPFRAVLMPVAVASLIVCTAAGGAFAPSPPAHAAPPPNSVDPQRITAVVQRDFPPLYTVDGEGNPSGFAVEVFQHVAERAGLEVTYRTVGSWRAMRREMEQGRAQVIPLVGRDLEGFGRLGYSRPLLSFAVCAFVRPDLGHLQRVAQLRDRPVATIDTPLVRQALEQHDLQRVETYPDYRQALFQVLSGHVDALILPAPVVWGLLRQIGQAHALEAVEEPLLEWRLSMAVHPDYPELLRRLDGEARAFAKSADFQGLNIKWIGGPAPFWTVGRVAWGMGAAAVLLVGVLLAWRHVSVVRMNGRLGRTITEREQAQSALAASEQRFRTLLERLPDGVAMARGNRYLYANPALARMFGYDDPEALTALDDTIVLLQPHERRRGRQLFAEAVRSGVPVQAEMAGRRRDGGTVWIDVMGQPAQWQGVRTLQLTMYDVTSRKEAELEQQRSERKYRDLVDGSAQGIAIAAESGQFVYANHALAHIFGYDRPDELLAVPDHKALLAPHERERVRSFHEARLRGEPAPERYEAEGRRRDGSPVWVELVARPTLWEGMPAVQLVTLDVTERKRASEELRRSEEKFRTLVEGSVQGFAIGMHDRFVFMNQAYAEIFGYDSPEELMGAVKPTEIVAPHERERLWANFTARMRGEPAPESYMFEGVRRDGTAVWCYMSVRRTEWEERPAAQIALVDVTEQVLAEEEVRRSEEKFRNLVEGALHGICIHRGGTPVFTNHAFARLLGYDSPESVLALGSMDAITAPDERDRMRGFAMRRLAGEEVPEHYEYRALRKDGTEIWLDLLARRVSWEGEPAIQMTVYNVHERKRAEAELRDSEQRFRDLVEGSLQGILVNRDFRFVFANDALAHMLGYADADELMALQDVRRMLPPHEQKRLWDYYQRRMAGKAAPERYEMEALRKDGRSAYFELFPRVVCWRGEWAVQATLVDITEHKAAEGELRDSEQRFRDLVEGSLQGILVHRDFRVLFVNDALALMLGYDSTEAVTAEDSMFNFLPQHEHERQREIYARRMSGRETPQRFEVEALRRDGQTVWFEVIHRVVNWRGAPAVQATLMDITERKRVEAEMRDSEQRYRDLVEGSLQGILVHRRSELLFANETLAHLLGYESAEELMALGDFRSIAAPDQHERMQYHHERRLAGESLAERFENRFVRKDGSTAWMEVFARRVYWQGEAAVQITVIDITARKEAETQLSRLAGAVEQAADAIAITCTDGVIRYANPAFQRTIGASPEQLQGRHLFDYAIGLQQHDDRNAIWSTARAGDVWHGHYTMQRNDGSLHQVEASVSGLRDETGVITDFIVIQRDVTEQLRLEAQLRRAQRMEIVGVLAGSIAHDFNNLLFPILGFSDILLGKFAHDSDVHRDLSVINQSAHRARELVAQILLFSRKTESNQVPTQVGVVVNEALGLLRVTLPTNISLDETMADDDVRVMGDPTKIHQVVMNLSINAVQAMPDGGRLSVDVAGVRLENGSAEELPLAEGDYVRIRVSDTGVGMERAVRERVFEPFFTTKPVGKGTGLGLATVYGIVQEHGGHVQVESAPGQGSTFEVYLPALQQAQEEDAEYAPEGIGGTESVLFVDDEESIAWVVERILMQRGYGVTAYTSAEEALEAFSTRPDSFDLVLTDQTMPGMTGADLVQAVRRVRPDVPVILLTGYSEVITPKKVEELGLNAFLLKPVEPQQLCDVVRRVLDGRPLSVEQQSFLLEHKPTP